MQIELDSDIEDFFDLWDRRLPVGASHISKGLTLLRDSDGVGFAQTPTSPTCGVDRLLLDNHQVEISLRFSDLVHCCTKTLL